MEDKKMIKWRHILMRQGERNDGERLRGKKGKPFTDEEDKKDNNRVATQRKNNASLKLFSKHY